MSKYIDSDRLKAEIEYTKSLYIGHAAITATTNAVDGLDAAIQVIDSLQQEQPAKRGYKDCNGCEYNRPLKDQIGWQFRGCFGGDYKGKPIAEIELCPLKVIAQQEQPIDVISPFSGGKVTLCAKEEELTYRGEKVTIQRQFYRCEDTGEEFTDAKLDKDMMWAVFRAYCEKKGFESFEDILPKEQPPKDLEEEISRTYHDGSVTDTEDIDHVAYGNIARHFYILGLKNNIPVTQITLDELAKEGEPVSKDLEEAAYYYEQTRNDLDAISDNEIVRRAFIAGAEWRYQKDRREFAKLKAKEWSDGYDEGIAKGKEQMLKDAVEGVAQPDDCEIWVNLVGYGYKFNEGDKVKIIIVKED